MKLTLIIITLLITLVIVFVVWKRTSVSRGVSSRDERLLALIDPIGLKIDSGEVVALQEVAELAARPEIRFMLFEVLQQMNRSDLLPTGYSSSIAQGESALAYWMMHPNELQDAPEKIEFVETMKRRVDGRDAEFHVYRYRMPSGHWTAKDGWLLGVVGPMPENAVPYAEMPSAFSRVGDLDGKVKPVELVDWYVEMLRQMGIIK